jgi:hypothetical protein
MGGAWARLSLPRLGLRAALGSVRGKRAGQALDDRLRAGGQSRGSHFEHMTQWMLAGQHQPHAARVAQHRRADLEQPRADRGRAGLLQFGARQGQPGCGPGPPRSARPGRAQACCGRSRPASRSTARRCAAQAARIPCSTLAARRGSPTARAAEWLGPSPSSTCLSRTTLPSVAMSPPSKAASTTRLPTRPSSIRRSVHVGIGRPPSLARFHRP